MALKLTALASLVHGCDAFAPSQGKLRTPTSSQQASAAAKPADAGASSGASFGVAGTAAAAVLATLSAVASKRQVSTRTALRAAEVDKYDRPDCLGPRFTYGGSGEVGIVSPIMNKFDPLNLGNTDAKMERYTEVEIKHGRVAMLACVGYWLPEAFRFPGTEKIENGLGALDSIPFEGWLQVVAFLGAHEIFVKPREGGMGNYDFGLGTELLEGQSDAEIVRRKTVERSNGRLAMVAIMGMMVQDYMFGMTPIKYLEKEGWWGEPVDWLVKDIPMCSFGCALPREKRSRAGLTAMRAFVYKDSYPQLPQEKEMSPACPFLKYPQPLKGWVGGEKGFDPLNVTMALPTYLVREAELKHGRVCMLATVGWIATDLGVRFPSEVFQKTDTINAHDACVEAGYMQPFLGAVGCLELYGGWLLMQGMAGDLPRAAGDFYVGKQFFPKEADKAADMQLKELENGRLAMIAFSGIVTQAVAFNKPFPF